MIRILKFPLLLAALSFVALAGAHEDPVENEIHEMLDAFLT